MRSTIAGVALSLVPLLAPAAAQAQAGPPAGTWGAEASIGGPSTNSLLRMRDDRSAFMLGFGLDMTRQGGTQSTSLGLRVGMRRYAPAGQALRPFHTLGVVTNITSGGPRFFEAGGFGELGAAYFLNRHVSVGASGEARATFGRIGTAPNDQSLVRFSIQGPRILATVFF